ncbi:MAG: Hpt domain-containing protein [Flavobacteriaceae bacterium]|nr:Hpt domain-containing protein [Flavobacteriaceae bacterium]
MGRHYSLDSLKEISGGDEEFMVVIASTFLEEIPPDLEFLEQAVVNNNKELAYQFAHKMKPNFEMFGIDVLKEVSNIESWTKTTKRVEVVQHNLDHILGLVNKVFDELKADFKL